MMKKLLGLGLGWLVPHKLKYRLFVVFVLIILLPFSILNLYNYQRIETLVQLKISEQSHEQLDQLLRSLEDQLSIAFKTLIFLEQDADIRDILNHPDKRTILDNKERMENKFKNLNNSFFLYNPSVYFTLLDFQGHVYTSYQPRVTLDYGRIAISPSFAAIQSSDATYFWVTDDENYVSRDISKSPSLLSLYAALRDGKGQKYGMARVSIDFSFFFQTVLQKPASDQMYFIVSGKGEQIASSAPGAHLSPDAAGQIAVSTENGYWRDSASGMLINYSYLPSLNWYVVNQIPLDVLFKDIENLKRQYFATFFLITAVFIALAFMIAHTFTRPLSHMQIKMKEAVGKDLLTRLPENNYKGEILELTRTFNTMMVDMNGLIHRLKAEERQRDAVHFQMLLAQVNPHFLLNTLNTMKWIGLRSRNEEIVEICLSLGKLLETSLNADVDLIHLQEELTLTKAFIYIQQVRYSNSFKVEFICDDALRYALVPKLSLQPLVDNAIRHGLANAEGEGHIVIRVGLDGQNRNRLLLEVVDNGVGIDITKVGQEAGRKRPGIGLANVRERLRLLFKEQASLELVPLEQGTLVRMGLPYLPSKPYKNPHSPTV